MKHKMKIKNTVRFEAAHHLPNLPDDHKCKRMHGHNWKVTIVCQGDVDTCTGWVIDFDVINIAWRPLFDAIDHRVLNDVEGLENPTSENVAIWIAERLQKTLPPKVKLFSVEVHENCFYSAIWEAE